jgi:hypothetical protein
LNGGFDGGRHGIMRRRRGLHRRGWCVICSERRRLLLARYRTHICRASTRDIACPTRNGD